MPDNAVRCNKCGVVLIDPRKRKIRSCSHYPVTMERDELGTYVIKIGTKNSENAYTSISVDGFNDCFRAALDWGKKNN